jgi:hypothetical protein
VIESKAVYKAAGDLQATQWFVFAFEEGSGSININYAASEFRQAPVCGPLLLAGLSDKQVRVVVDQCIKLVQAAEQGFKSRFLPSRGERDIGAVDFDEYLPGKARWAQVERIVERHLVPELVPGTFANCELLVSLGEDAEGRPEGLADNDARMIKWAGDAWVYQMGFFRWPGEVCGEVKLADGSTRELTDEEAYQLVIERMDDRGLKPRIVRQTKYEARPETKPSIKIFQLASCLND